MKTKLPHLFCRMVVATTACVFVPTLSAWSPPAGESVMVNPGHVQIRNGILEARGSTAANNLFGTSPALVVGHGNDLLRTGTTHELGRGIVLGQSNFLSCPSSSFSGLFGSANNAVASYSLVLGYGNMVSYIASGANATTVADITWQNASRYSLITGSQNIIGYDTENLFVTGRMNTVRAYHSLVAGYSNTLQASTGTASSSAAIGSLNLVSASTGWAIGGSNTVSGTSGVAIGIGLTTSKSQSTALGRFNSDMQSNDVLVVGSGTDANTKFTALRVTSDGGVILGRAQGDVSMGIYSN